MPRATNTPGASAPRDAVLYEVSWEVCNQIGGIYQVLRSKAEEMSLRWRDRYSLVGPYVGGAPSYDFEPRRPSGRLATLVERLAESGVRAHTGRWLVQGSPRVILLERTPSAQELDALKFEYWNRHGIDLPTGDHLMDQVVVFADSVARLVRAVCEQERERRSREPRRVVVHAHEWMGGAALPTLRAEGTPAKLVFTTHATMLGRYLASSGEPLYDRLPEYDAAEEAERFGIGPRHGVERACAEACDVMSTVSPITGEECARLLGREPDAILPNGLNIERFDVGHEFQTLHAHHKEKIHRFSMGHFFPSYPFDLDRTLYMFTSGRFEPRNKGFDLCLEAMARLNTQLRAFDIGVTVVFFIVTNRPTRSINPDALHGRGVLNELRVVCDEILRTVGERFFPRAAAGEAVDLDDMVTQYWALRYRRTQQALRRSALPMVVTHLLEDDANDPVLDQIRRLGLFNRPEDPVKIVYHPEFISPVNPLWGMEYEQFVRGCHLGVFPSAYEPWGYTPLECVAMGVPAITSDLAGFGRFVAERMPSHEDWGLTVLKRRGRSFDAAAADLARWLLAFCRLNRQGRIDLRNRVVSRAAEFDWSRLARAYSEAHRGALEAVRAELG